VRALLADHGPSESATAATRSPGREDDAMPGSGRETVEGHTPSASDWPSVGEAPSHGSGSPVDSWFERRPPHPVIAAAPVVPERQDHVGRPDPSLSPTASTPGPPSLSGGFGGSAKHAITSDGGLFGWLQRRGIRIDPGQRAGLAMGLAAAVAALIAGWWVFSSRPHTVAVASSAGPTPTPTRSSAHSSAGAARLVVDVVGKVHHPGVYHLPDDARVDDALHAAGGPLRGVDLSSLNLARRLIDGEQIAVGVAGAAPPTAAAGTGSASGPVSGPVNLNTAGIAQLEALPGVGPVLAQRILDWRTAHGRFASVDQLREVTGIGESRFADLKPLVTV
jgi:competence protein ComEA